MDTKENLMNREDTAFLQELSKELKTQDNRCTANPIYIVQDEKRIWGNYNDGGDGYVWVHKYDSDYYFYNLAEAQNWLIQEEDNLEDFDNHFESYEYITEWVYKSAHFTEKAAQLYIDQNKHNLNNPRIYVESQYRCHEFNKLIEIIKNNF